MVNNLKKIRQDRGLSQVELSKKALISRPYLSDIENDVSVPSTPIALRLASSLSCTVEDIFLNEMSYMVDNIT